MKIFLDTSDVDVIRQHCETGLIDGVTTNPTLMMKAGRNPVEVIKEILAAKAGATYVSPFVGRCEDNNIDGIGLLETINKVYQLNKISTEILSASIRNLNHISESFKAGADIVTLPPSIFEEMYKHDLTDQGIAQFNEDWKKLNS